MCGRPETPVEHISIDSRTMKGNDLFVPLIGEKVDAHRFIMQAINAGAVAVFTSEHDQMEEEQSGGAAWIRVEDTKKMCIRDRSNADSSTRWAESGTRWTNYTG